MKIIIHSQIYGRIWVDRCTCKWSFALFSLFGSFPVYPLFLIYIVDSSMRSLFTSLRTYAFYIRFLHYLTQIHVLQNLPHAFGKRNVHPKAQLKAMLTPNIHKIKSFLNACEYKVNAFELPFRNLFFISSNRKCH